MTSDLSDAIDVEPGWFVHTDNGITLSPRCDSRESAQTVYWDVITALRQEMVRSGRTRAVIEERIRAVHIGYGVPAGSWGEFAARQEPR